MKETRWAVRANAREKKIIERLAKEKNMTISNYINYRLFDTNPHLQDDEYSYDTASDTKHAYLTIGAEYFNHYLIRELIKKLYPEDETSLYQNAHKRATEKINLLGYKKDKKKETSYA